VGSAVVFALTVLTPVLVASGTVLSQLRAYSDEVDHRIRGVTTQLVAASGAHDALARLTADLAFRGEFEVELNGGRATVDVTQVDGEETLDVADDLMQVRSEGWINGPADGESGLPRVGSRWYRSVVNATARPRMIRVPIEQTLFIADPDPQLYLSGTAFRIAGEDQAPDARMTLPGMGVTGDPAAVVDQFATDQQPLVTGSAAESTASVHRMPMVDVEGWLDRYRLNPTILWESATERLDSCQLGTDAEPAVAFAEGNLVVRGTVVGRGALLVRGNLRVTGSLDFEGVILVGGAACFRNAMGTRTRHRGALLVGGSDTIADLEVVGDVQILYDSSALDRFVGRFVSGVEVATWDHDLEAGLPDDGSQGGTYP
jgi:hypothetical protein